MDEKTKQIRYGLRDTLGLRILSPPVIGDSESPWSCGVDISLDRASWNPTAQIMDHDSTRTISDILCASELCERNIYDLRPPEVWRDSSTRCLELGHEESLYPDKLNPNKHCFTESRTTVHC